jgi:hypothetical protein
MVDVVTTFVSQSSVVSTVIKGNSASPIGTSPSKAIVFGVNDHSDRMFCPIALEANEINAILRIRFQICLLIIIKVRWN